MKTPIIVYDGYSELHLFEYEYDGIKYMVGEEIPSYLWEPFNISFFGVRPVLPVNGAVVYAHDFLSFVYLWREGKWKISDKALLKAIYSCWERVQASQNFSFCAPRGGRLCEDCKRIMPWV